MSRTRGKREAAGGGWHTDGDPFGEERTGKKKRKKGRGKKAALIVLCCLALVAVGGAAWWNIYVKAPDVSDNDRPGVGDKTQTPNATDTDQDGEPDSTDGESGRKEDYFTFLLIGRDTAGGGNTDTLILVSYDVPNGQVNMMSIPRDTMVNVSWTPKKVNSVYNMKESSGGGIGGLKTQVGYLTGVVPDFYVIIEWKAVGELVKAVGGVEFDVPRDMNYDDEYQNLHIHLKKGLQTLNGDQAMAMLRYRNDNKLPDGTILGYDDTGRAETQREFLKAMAKKVIQLQNMTKIGDFIKIFMENVETDLKLNNLMWFATKALSVDTDSIQSFTLPHTDIRRFRGAWYFTANPEEIVPLVNDYFNPYNRDITSEDLQIVQKNKDGSCYVTNGELLDSRWAKAYSSGSSGNSSSSSGSSNSSSGETAEPTVPSEGDGGTPADPGASPDPGMEPGDPGNTGDGGEMGPVPEGPGGTEEPTLPPEPSLPEEGMGQTGGEPAGDPGDSAGGIDTVPPDWLTTGG